jgi:hypothetical protein
MKLLDPLRHMFTHRRRSRYVVLVASRQGHNALALLMNLHRGISYEVYNAAHASREPRLFEHYDQALRYMFPRAIDAAQTPENRQLRTWAEGRIEDELFARGATALPPAPVLPPRPRDTDDQMLNAAIVTLGNVGTERAAALALEIRRGMERRRQERP